MFINTPPDYALAKSHFAHAIGRALDNRGRFADNPLQLASRTVKSYRKTFDLLRVIGATRRSRTDDLLITNQLLYQLS
jgi:hypothetical protein